MLDASPEVFLLVTGLLVVGTSESAKGNAVLVLIKVTALTAFIALTFTSHQFCDAVASQRSALAID